MTITTSQTDGMTILKVGGDLLIGNVTESKPAIVAALAMSGDLRLDLSEIGECDTAGMQLLLMARASARAQGKRFFTTALTSSFQAIVARIGILPEYFECQEGTR
jgi:anti-anti-sigma regulatory factor